MLWSSATHPPPSDTDRQCYRKKSVGLTYLSQDHSSALILSRLGSINHGVVCSILTETVIGVTHHQL